MGMDANVICIGPFGQNVADCLDYPKDNYEEMEEGMPVTVETLNCSSSSTSAELADALGLDPYDFRTHVVNKDNVDWEKMFDIVNMEWDEDVLKKFRTLIENNFICIYRPNY